MKKLLSLILAAIMLFAAALPALAEENDNFAILPLLETLLDAPMVDAMIAEDESSMQILYSPATEDHLSYFLALASAVGTYPYYLGNDTESGILGYQLIAPGTSYDGAVYYFYQDEMLLVDTASNIAVLDTEEEDQIVSFLSQEVQYPEGTSGYILPEFSAIVGKKYTGAQRITGADHIFDGKETYFEHYDGIDLESFSEYVQFMMIFGFNPEVDGFLTDRGVADPIRLHLTNEEMEVIVSYDCANQIADVFYKPGILPYILNQSQVLEALGR